LRIKTFQILRLAVALAIFSYQFGMVLLQYLEWA